MSDLKERLKLVLKTLHIKNIEFSEATGFSTAYISMILNPESNKPVAPSARFYKAVQREYNINPEWLEKGEGEMFCSEGNGLSSKQHDFIKKYYSLTEKSRLLVDSIIDKFLIADNIEQEKELGHSSMKEHL